MTPKETIEKLDMTIKVEFVPYSQSRSFKKTADLLDKNLNWTITLMVDGREILTTDYSAGLSYCPSYRHGPITVDQATCIKSEIETGESACYFPGAIREAIKPDPVDVIYSLVSDSEVIDYSCFEEWADAIGLNTDSKKDEAIYMACLKIALAMRNGIGHEAIEQLREAYQGY